LGQGFGQELSVLFLGEIKIFISQGLGDLINGEFSAVGQGNPNSKVDSSDSLEFVAY
jgi:hypothetical protein